MAHIRGIIDEAQSREGIKFSFEYFPPKTDNGVEALFNRFWRMNQQAPLFADVTWGAGGSTSELTMELCATARKLFGLEINMHLTCTNMPQEVLEKALRDAKANGIHNICALRGDPPAGQKEWKAVEGGFTCALDLIKYIREHYGDYFGISCAGYPEGHPVAITNVSTEEVDSLSPTEKSRLILIDGQHMVCRDKDYEKEIDYLKQKVEAGASVVITQLFYDAAVFIDFVKVCRAKGIMCPILPGIMPIGNYGGFKRMVGFCKTRVPSDIMTRIEAVKDNKTAFESAGIEITTALCKQVLASKEAPPLLHFYTLNNEEPTYTVLRNLGVDLVEVDEEEKTKVAGQVKELMAKRNNSKDENDPKKPKTN